MIGNLQLTQRRPDVVAKPPSIGRIAGRGPEIRNMPLPKGVEWSHGKLAQVFGGHRSESRGQMLLPFGLEAKFDRATLVPNLIDGQRGSLVADDDEFFGKDML